MSARQFWCAALLLIAACSVALAISALAAMVLQ